MTDIETARSIAEEHSKQGSFNFLDRLNNRNYPTEDVEIYLDEKAGHEIEKLQEKIVLATKPEIGEALQAEIDEIREQAKASRYIVHMQGISVELYDEIVDKSQEMYPLEHREYRDPLTAKLIREVVDNDDREQYFRTHLWAEFVRSVEDIDGNVDDNITPEFMAVFIGHAPIAAQVKVAAAVQSLRMVTAWMDEIQGEDFLAKS